VCHCQVGAAELAVGAVYDRATFASDWAKCAVIDRAYSGHKLTAPSLPTIAIAAA
jgi:hypothetical protein